ncbi:MAG TPA: UvrD-helicase domain-containing protein [bacterium]|nr:UvrD-helicase domain-containing protein [bacterium]
MNYNIYSQYKNYENEIIPLFTKNIYISNSELKRIEDKYSEAPLNINGVVASFIRQLFSRKPFKAISILFSAIKINKIKSDRMQHNKDVIRNEVEKEYEIEGKKLDKQQIVAVVACEDANLVMAAAGSGKTLTLLAKLKYLIDVLQIPSSSILIISFTRNTVNDLKKRVSKLGYPSKIARTFHSLGNWIIKETDLKKKRLVKEKELKKTVLKIINDLSKNEEYQRKYNDYILNYHTVPFDMSEIKGIEERVSFNKMFTRPTLKKVSIIKDNYNIKKPTKGGEYVKSKEEQIIANFLFINQVSYEYEKQYPYVQTKYEPDFTLNQNNTEVYLEHFGINRDGTTAPWVNSLSYHSQMNWKRKTHVENNTTLLESYTYQWKEHTLLSGIEAGLKKVGIKPRRLSEEEISKLIEESYKKDVDSFLELCVTFLNLFKNSALSLEELENKINTIDDKYQFNRTRKFYEIYKPIYLEYQKYLEENDLQDFADMIKVATEKIKDLPEENFQYKYILVDEVQDLSYGKYSLLKALLDKSPGCRLYCVGDDWQSIYRFTGSDLTLINDFTNFFNRVTYRSLIETTHRFGDPTIKYSTNFILKNPNQVEKTVSPGENKITDVKIHLNKVPDDDANSLNQIMLSLSSKYSLSELKNKKILIISRYNRDLDRLQGSKVFNIVREPNNKSIIIEWKFNKKEDLIKIRYCTMHRAKGLTEDIVIVLNCNEGYMGMPATQSDDPILNILLAHPDDYPFAEERRLFYVSITRARNETHIIANKDNPSRFLFELDSNLLNESREMCPMCKTGELIIRKSNFGLFKGCSNFKFGCDFTEKIESGGNKDDIQPTLI